jgi:drug/metabolite transporter (DMT)-like permease
VPSSELSRPGAHALLQGVVVLWGATAVLGHLISIHAIPLVWYRLVLVVAVMLVVVPARGLSLRVTRRQLLHYGITGVFIGLHWVCFYGAIKQAGIATAVLTLSTITFFTAVIEPIAFRRRVSGEELLIGAIVVGGVALLERVELEADALGLALGFGSAFLAAVFGVLNGKLARGERPERLLLYEMIAALAVVTICFVFDPVAPSSLTGSDVGWLAVLAVMCTVIPQLWVLLVVRVLSPFTVALSVNLEPVYALILAALVLPATESPSRRFYAGSAVLLGLIIANAARARARAGAASRASTASG